MKKIFKWRLKDNKWKKIKKIKDRLKLIEFKKSYKKIRILIVNLKVLA